MWIVAAVLAHLESRKNGLARHEQDICASNGSFMGLQGAYDAVLQGLVHYVNCNESRSPIRVYWA